MSGGFQKTKDELVAELMSIVRCTPCQAQESLVTTYWSVPDARAYFSIQSDRPEMAAYEWASIDPRTHSQVTYSDSQMRALEREFQTPGFGHQVVTLVIGGQNFYVNVKDKRQLNDHKKGRNVVRTPDLPPDWQNGAFVPNTRAGLTPILDGIAPASSPPAQRSGSGSVSNGSFSRNSTFSPGTPSLSGSMSAAPLFPSSPAVSSPGVGSGGGGGGAPIWFSIDPRNQCTHNYGTTECNIIEAAYQTPGFAPDVVIMINGCQFRIDVSSKKQYNMAGGARMVGRNPDEPPRWVTRPAGSVAPLVRPQASAPPAPPRLQQSVVSPLTVLGPPGGSSLMSPHSMSASSSMASMAFSPSAGSTCQGYSSDGEEDNMKKYRHALTAIAEVDEHVAIVTEKPLCVVSIAKLEAVQRKAALAVLPIYEEILNDVHTNAEVKKRFGGSDGTYGTLSPQDDALFQLKVGDDVPHYYANVVGTGESIYRRKVLSLLGLRNLVEKGATVYRDLQAKLFIGNEGSYGSGAGLKLMKKLTGNTVDLDDLVLRCDDGMLKLVNTANAKAGIAQHPSAESFGNSDQAKQMALQAAQVVLQNFIDTLKLSPAQQEERQCAVPKPGYKIPVATSNSHRAKSPLWHVCENVVADKKNFFVRNA